jgi:diguanylate cyclase (GGDEF)-like protein
MKDLTDNRDVGPRFGSPLWIHMTAVTIAGTVAFGFAMVDLAHQNIGLVIDHPLFWVLGGMVVLGDIWPIVTPGKTATEAPRASVAFCYAALIAWGLPLALLLRVTSTILISLGRRRAPHRAAFTAAAAVLGLAAAAGVFSLANHHPSPRKPWVPDGDDPFLFLLAGAASFAVIYTIVSIAGALHSREPVLQTIRRYLPYQAFAALVLIATAPLVAVVIHTGYALLVLLFAFPLAAVYANTAVSVRREHQAHHDELTGLPNRKMLMRTLDASLAKATASGTKAGFLMLDLDRGLKEVNDTLGHAVGDRLLRLVAHRLAHSIRPGDTVARLGGDEFAVVLPGVKDAAVAREVAARLRAAVAEPIRLEGMSFVIEVSIGIAMYPDDATADELLMQRADVAMYLAKQRRSGVERYVADLDRNSPSRLAVFGDLRRALDRGELELHYQPKVYLDDWRVAGMEALIRWRHPVRGMLTPPDFLPIVQQSYLMRELTGFVIDRALTQVGLWRQSGVDIQVSINVAGRDLLDNGLADLVEQCLNEHRLPPECLIIEIDERVLTNEPAYAIATAEALADIGVGVSLDDFGTGYSSLVRLKRLPVREVKMDSSFVSRLLESSDDKVVVQSIIDLAAALGIRSVAEGVESAALADALLSLGCVAGQGWHFAKPMNAASASTWLTEHSVPCGERRPEQRITLAGRESAQRRPVVAPPSGWRR